MRRIPWERLVRFGVDLLTAKGVAADKARFIAETQVDTEAMGVTTHGVALFGYFERAVGRDIDPQREPAATRDSGAGVVIDGEGVFAQLAMRLARRMGSERARRFGVAMVAVRDTSWLGGLGVHLVDLARGGLMAQLWSQSSHCCNCPPFGGIDARFSTNPVAMACPMGDDIFLADLSTSAISMGQLGRLKQAGGAAADRIFLDADGGATADPAAMAPGGMQFLGGEWLGYKGYALSIWDEALAALGGGSCNNPEAPARHNLNLTVVAPSAFGDAERFRRETGRFRDRILSSRPRPGVEAVRIPGQRAMAGLREGRAKGVVLDEAMLAGLDEIAGRCGIEAL